MRMSVRFTRTRMLPAYVVHEIHGIPDGGGRPATQPPSADDSMCWGGVLRSGEAWGEQEGGRDLMPSDTKRWWRLLDDERLEVRVSAAPLRHTVPCVGFVVKESDKEGRLKPELVCFTHLA